jgi:hypothetical protein
VKTTAGTATTTTSTTLFTDIEMTAGIGVKKIMIETTAAKTTMTGLIGPDEARKGEAPEKMQGGATEAVKNVT